MNYRDIQEIILIATFTLVAVLLFIFPPFYTVNPGFTAIQVRLGRIIKMERDGGTYFKIPFIDKIIEMPNGIQKASIETNALSKDLQAISIGIDINYRYTNEIDLYKATRNRAEEIIIIPFCHETIKSVIAKYTAEELILHRHEAKENIYNDLKSRLRSHYIDFIEVNFSHADFSREFIKAVEDKQIALQKSMMEKNITESIKENATQQKIIADAEAYAQEVKKQSITKELAQLKAIEKWDGVLPKVVNGNIPFISLEHLN